MHLWRDKNTVILGCRNWAPQAIFLTTLSLRLLKTLISGGFWALLAAFFYLFLSGLKKLKNNPEKKVLYQKKF